MHKAAKAKKLVFILTISALIIGTSKEAQVIQIIQAIQGTQGTSEVVLDRIFYIY